MIEDAYMRLEGSKVAHSRKVYLMGFIVHAGIGLIISISSTFTFLWGLTPICIGLIHVILVRNRNEVAAVWAAYATGMEVVLRMEGAYATYEASKYYVIILLLAGYAFGERRHQSAFVFILLGCLLAPSIFLTSLHGDELRKAILFNLSGPFTLLVSGFYFYRRPISTLQINNILVGLILPIVCTLVVLQIKTPDLYAIQYTAESNFETSGGFGPNQVSTLLGCGILIIFLALVLDFQITGSRLIDVVLLASLLFRGIITFSRGGILAPIVVLVTFFLLTIVMGLGTRQRFSKYLVVAIAIGSVIWTLAVDVTGGQIENRYLGLSAKGKQTLTLTSGRTDILINDYQVFVDNPILGSGVGMSKIWRERKFGYLAASHSEFSRLISEHGSFGILFLVLILSLIVYQITVSSKPHKIWLITFVLYSLLTINHAAMRTALPGFVFGLAFITVYTNRFPKT